MPGYSSFPATRFPFTDAEQQEGERRGGLQTGYTAAQQPKVIYTNTPVEYWGQGRAAALTHTAIDGSRDLTLPDNVRSYLLAGTQHGEAAFPPPAGQGQALANPTPQGDVMRALLRAAHRWVTAGTPPPASRVPRLADGTLTPVAAASLPGHPGGRRPAHHRGSTRAAAVPGAAGRYRRQRDRRRPGAGGGRAAGHHHRLELPHRAHRQPDDHGCAARLLLSRCRGRARTARRATIRVRRSRSATRGREDYLGKIRAAALDLVKSGFMLDEDVELTLQRAGRHWDWAVANR